MNQAAVSIEMGHLSLKELVNGEDAVRAVLAGTLPWIAALRAEQGATTQFSTCFLIDDYFSRSLSPAMVIPMVLIAAERAGAEIDYLARESACASALGMMPGGLFAEGRWLTGRQPPSGRRRHSIFVDVELWDERGGQRTWSCPMLAAVWQLMRLGLTEATSQVWSGGDWPDSWDALPSVIRLRPEAATFAARSTFSVLATRYLPVELAVRSIVSEFAGTEADEVTNRIRYVFT